MTLLLTGFTLLTILSCAYSIMAGGRPARIACLMMAIATVATRLATLDHDARLPLLLVDTSLLAGLVVISLYTDRFWPLWTAGLQAAGVASNIAVMLSERIDFNIYHAVIAFWSIPIFLVMPLGIYLDQKAARNAKPRDSGRVEQD